MYGTTGLSPIQRLTPKVIVGVVWVDDGLKLPVTRGHCAERLWKGLLIYIDLHGPARVQVVYLGSSYPGIPRMQLVDIEFLRAASRPGEDQEPPAHRPWGRWVKPDGKHGRRRTRGVAGSSLLRGQRQGEGGTKQESQADQAL